MMHRQLIALFLTLLVGFTLQKSTHKFSTCFTDNPSQNTLLASFDSVTFDSSNNGWKASFDPNTIPSQRKGIVGYWAMDTSSGGFTPDGSRQPLPAQIMGTSTISASAGKFGGGFMLNNDGYLQFTGPLIASLAVSNGFTYGIWAKPTLLNKTAVLVSQQYTQPTLAISSTSIQCAVHNSLNQPISASVRISNVLNTWIFVACIYHPVNGVSVCVNANCSRSSNSTIDVFASRKALTGVGSFAGSLLSGFTGVLDELTIWNRPLTTSEVAAIASSSSANTPFYGTSFTSLPMNATDLGISDSSIVDFWEVQPSWSILPIGSSTTDPSTGILVEISTNRGNTWCALSSNQLADFNNTVCAMPASTVTFRVTFFDNVVLTCLDLVITVQPDMNWNYFPLGTNTVAFNYYSPTWVYTDVFKGMSDDFRTIGDSNFTKQTTRASMWTCSNYPCTTIQFNDNGYPLYVNGTEKPATFFQVRDFPTGNYTFMADGVGAIQAKFSCPNVVINVNGSVVQTVNCSVAAIGIQLVILQSSASNPIRNIRVIMPGFENTYQTQKFHPRFLERYNGSDTYRFMDWTATNGNNIAYWEDRNLPSFAIQRRGKTTVLQLTKFVDASTTGSSAFLGTQWLVKVMTSQPHNLVMGQQVTVYTNTPASVTVKLPSGSSETNVLDSLTGYVDPIDNYSFFMDYSLSTYTAGTTLVSFTPSTSGNVTYSANSGNNYEDAIELSNTLNVNAWINIPVVATDDFVTKYATLLRDNLKPNLKIFVEYSNEIWNSGFIQYGIVTQIGTANGLGPANDVRLRQTVYRICQILSIFKQVFGDDAFNQRIVKLLPSQVSSNMVDLLLSFANNATLNPQGFKFDGAAIAPYFGYSLSTSVHNMFAKNITPTVDQVLDLTRDNLWFEVSANVRDCVAVAAQYGAKLFGYEGGQSLVPEFGPYRQQQVPIYTAANRHPRMKNIYMQFYYMWMSQGGDLFCHYNDYATPSEWGFWGALEYQTQPTEVAYKYQAWVETLLLTKGMMPSSPVYSDSPSQSNSPGSNSPGSNQSPSPSALSNAIRNSASLLLSVPFILF